MTSTETKTRNARRNADPVAETIARRRSGVAFYEWDGRDYDRDGKLFEQLLADLPRSLTTEFTVFYAEIVAEFNAAKEKRKSVEHEISMLAMRRRRAAGQCTRCSNRGTITVHVHSGNAMIDDGIRTCPSCKGTAPEITLPFDADELAAAEAARPADRYYADRFHNTAIEKLAEAEARDILGFDLRVAKLAEQAAALRVNAFSTAASREKGSRVRYENKRARAKFWNKGGKVPVGTEGVVTWVEHYDGEPGRYTILTDDGRKFSTSVDNLGSYSVNGWERAMKIDRASEVKQERERAANVKAAKVEAAPLKRGDKVKNPETGREVSVFYVGFSRANGCDPKRLRYGARKSNPIWGYVDELPGMGGDL